MQLSWYVFPNHTSFTFTFVNELSREKWKNSILRIPALTIKHVSFMYFTITYYLVMFEKKTTMHWRMREGGRGIYITIYLSKVWSISCNFVKHFLLICPSPPPPHVKVWVQFVPFKLNSIEGETWSKSKSSRDCRES